MKGVVYYSKNGNTEILAELLAEKYGAKKIKLEEVQKRKGIIGFIKSGYQAASGKCSELIGAPWDEAGEFDEIYLCTPIWAGNTTPAVNTFIRKADFTNKRVNIITVMADPKLDGAEKVHEHITDAINAKGGIAIKCTALCGSSPFKPGERNHIEAQFDKLL